MRHAEIKNKLLLYQENGVDATLRAEIAAHLEHCEGCRQLLVRISRIYGAPAMDARVAAPASLYPRLRARWQANQPGAAPSPARAFSPVTGRLFPAVRSLAAAVLLLAAIGAGLFLGALPEPPTPTTDQIPQLRAAFYTDLFDAANTHSYYQAVEQVYQPAAAEGR